jgi:hypothetical protein
MTLEELNADMVASEEKIIEAMLSHKSQSGQVSLDEIERLAVEVQGAFGAALVSELMKAEQEARRREGAACPECGNNLMYRGQRERQLVTEYVFRRVNRQGLNYRVAREKARAEQPVCS